MTEVIVKNDAERDGRKECEIPDLTWFLDSAGDLCLAIPGMYGVRYGGSGTSHLYRRDAPSLQPITAVVKQVTITIEL